METAYLFPPAPPLITENVQDLLSGETLFSAKCPKTEDCVALKLVFVKSAFDYVMNNASEPLELEKEMAT